MGKSKKKDFEDYQVDYVDPTPHEASVEMTAHESIEDKIKRVLIQMQGQLKNEYGVETIDEAEDLDIEDDFDHDPLSGYEVQEVEDEYVDQSFIDKEKERLLKLESESETGSDTEPELVSGSVADRNAPEERNEPEAK